MALDNEKAVSRAALMARAQNGDREAFQALFEEIGPLIAAFLRRHSSDQTEIEDVCQEVLIAVYKSRHTYQPKRPFEPWMFAIVRRVAAQHFRRNQQRLAWQIQTDQVLEPHTGNGPSLAVELRDALEELSPTQKEALALTKLRGLSVADASRRAGTTVGSMKVRVHRAYEALKRALTR